MNVTTSMKAFLTALLTMVISFFLLIIPAGSQEASPQPASGKSPSRELADLVQTGDQFGSFKKAVAPEYYFPDTLFDYINGGAELFLAYGFAELMVAVFVEDGNPAHRATLEVYNMGTIENAYGVSRAEQGGDPYKLPGGAEGRLGNGMLQFYKDRFYVNIFLPPTSKAFPAVAEHIGTTIEGRIKGTFSRPDCFDLLPLQYRRAGSENYTNKDFLGQPFFYRIASAQYSQGNKTYTVFLSATPDSEAVESLKKYKDYLKQEQAYLGELQDGIRGIAGRDPYYGNCAVAVVKGRIAGVLGNPDGAAAILKSIQGGNDEKK